MIALLQPQDIDDVKEQAATQGRLSLLRSALHPQGAHRVGAGKCPSLLALLAPDGPADRGAPGPARRSLEQKMNIVQPLDRRRLAKRRGGNARANTRAMPVSAAAWPSAAASTRVCERRSYRDTILVFRHFVGFVRDSIFANSILCPRNSGIPMVSSKIPA